MDKTDHGPFTGVDEDEALRIIMEGTATETGQRFFNSLVQNVSKALNTKGAWVTEYIPESKRVRSIAFWFDGKCVDDCEYELAGTPCGKVIEEARLVHVAENVVELYPDDPDLEPLDAVSFMGVPLMDSDNNVLGHLAVLDSEKMPRQKRLETIFRIFAARASAELQRIRAEREIIERKKMLGRLVDSAMDAIIELNNMLEIIMMNSAAEKVFSCYEAELKGKSFLDFLCEDSAKRLPELIVNLGYLPEGKRYLWIAGGLEAKTSQGQVFPAEATISQYELAGRRYYTIILRNIDQHLETERKIKLLTDEAEYLRKEVQELNNYGEIIGDSEPLKKVFQDIDQVSKSETTVLILGETGTGKELVASAIHNTSGRRDKPFIKVNCGSIPESLIESELFGHEKGAFTGATSKRDGRFTLAHGGTIFLDEIGELKPDMQTKLLRVLQEGEFEPVGSSKTNKTDVRVLAATNRDLLNAVKAGEFRQDLYYRLNVFPIMVPPLRQRGEDVFKIAESFSKKFADRNGVQIKPLNEDQIEALSTYDWPGNVRELQNVIELAVITSNDGVLNIERALPNVKAPTEPEVSGSSTDIRNKVRTVKELQEIEKENIIQALEMTNWRVSGERGAARLLGMPPTTLSSRIKALGIKRPN